MNPQLPHAFIQKMVVKASKSPDPFIRWLGHAWRQLESVFLLFVYCRWSVLVILIGAGLLLLTDQGRELAVRTGDSWRYSFSALLGTAFWAVHSWLSSRRILESIYTKDRGAKYGADFKNLIDKFPRLIGLMAFFLAFIAFFMAFWKIRSIGSLFLLLFDLLIGFWFYRLMENRENLMNQLKKKQWLQRIVPVERDNLELLINFITPLTVCYSVIFFAWATFDPVSFGFSFGSLGIVFFALSSIVAAGSYLTLRGMNILKQIDDTPELIDPLPGKVKLLSGLIIITLVVYRFEFKGLITLIVAGLAFWVIYKMLTPLPNLSKSKTVPSLSVLVLMALLFSSFNLNDNHGLQTVDRAPTQPDFNTYANAWFQQAPAVQSDPRKPMVIVATAGGGVRAAYWTGAVLSEITDTLPSFRQSIFGISGVSGGSVGAAVYNASLHELGSTCEKANPGEHCLKTKILNGLSEEFLAPVIASMLYPDLAQRFLPVSFLPDRAQALESAWQKAWQNAMEKPRSDGLNAPFSSLIGTTTNGWQPALLFNSTHVETGRRVIASSIKLEHEEFRHAIDLLALLQKDIRLGTAALNSARFTFVSPPATLPCSEKQKGQIGFLKRLFCDNGHVVDGGYFENFGAVTALQLLNAAQKSFAETTQIRPLVILISNDHTLTKPDLGTIESKNFIDPLPSEGFANESLGPFRALFGTREARAILAAKDLRAAVQPNDFFHFRMELGEGDVEPALGWVLSNRSEKFMASLLLCADHNREEFQRLLKALGSQEEINTKQCKK